MQFVHLAGTNAKGSTASYIANIISEEHSCGLYTSPHLLSPRERMKIDGEEISEAEYKEYFECAKDERDEHLFGIWTRAALKWFDERKAEYAVIETGLGGRLDPTNVVASKMQILTPISYDHMELLGNTLTKIAREKCGIIKKDSIVISHPQTEEAMRVILQTCRGKNARLIVLDEKKISVKQSSTRGQRFDFNYAGKLYKNLEIHGISPMQAENACVAIMAAAELGMDEKSIRDGLLKTEIPARVEVKGNVLIDGAHNPEAIAELARTVKKLYPHEDVTVLAAIMRDKDVQSIANVIESFANRVVCTCAEKKRGMSGKELAVYFDPATVAEDPNYAFLEAQRLAEQKKGILVVCGSFYLAAYALERLNL
ncbi:MAG: Mur ligase family protein [Christensenella sp.]